MRKIKGLSKFKEYLWPSVMEGGVTPSPVDKSQLISIIDYWDSSSSEYPPENYTPESYQAVLDAYAVAVDVRDDGEATQQEVDDAYLDLLNAISGLVEVGGECVYPLDIEPELLSLMGFVPFNVLDSCGHNLTCSGADSHAAISQAAAEALVGGGQIPEEHILPPSFLGDGIYAVEFKLNFNLEQAAAHSQVTFDLGRLHIEEGEPSGYVSIVQGKTDRSAYTTLWAYPKSPSEGGFRLFEGVDALAEVTLGLYYNSTTKQFGASTDFFGDHGYLGIFEAEQACVLFLSSISPPSLPDGAGLHAEIRTKGHEMQLAYPEGAMGLDGVLVGG